MTKFSSSGSGSCGSASAESQPAPSLSSRAAGRVSPLKPCGTNAAYVRHRYHNEAPCAACINAHRLACLVVSRTDTRRAYSKKYNLAYQNGKSMAEMEQVQALHSSQDDRRLAARLEAEEA